MLKDKAVFEGLAESFSDEVGNADRNQAAVEKRGTARCLLLDSKGKQCELVLKQALWVPNYTGNLISVKTPTQPGAEVIFKNDFSTKDV